MDTEVAQVDLTLEFCTMLGLNWNTVTTVQRERARKMLSHVGASVTERFTTTFKAEWDKFLSKLLDGHREALEAGIDSAVFFSQDDMESYMAVHCQKSGICSSHAGVTFQHEVASCRKPRGEKDHKMLDISDFILNHLPAENQKQYILTGVTGLNSFYLTRLFTNTRPHNYARFQPCRKEDDAEMHSEDILRLVNHFRKHKEPGLVSEFKIEDRFFENVVIDGHLDETKYEEYKTASNDDKERLHAMVLVGIYTYDGRHWFVLQNSHQDGFFKVVDAEYLASCCAIVSFAHKKVDMSLKKDFKIVEGEYVEAECGMMGECAEEAHAEG
ncbi:MAG: hypothetical protein SGILL_002748 [Bacillariaceae sp.]